MRKPAFCICENKDSDQLRGNRKADQRLCFCYTDSTIPLLPKSEISSLQPSSVAVQPGLCGTRSKTPKNRFSQIEAHLVSYFELLHDITNKVTFAPSQDFYCIFKSHSKDWRSPGFNP